MEKKGVIAYPIHVIVNYFITKLLNIVYIDIDNLTTTKKKYIEFLSKG
jgi:hypothetical protein